MGTKANPGKWDCYANAEQDEPMFILLARDRHAPLLVLVWAVLRWMEGEDEAKVREAVSGAWDMIAWRRLRGKATSVTESAWLAMGVARLAMGVAKVAMVKMASEGAAAAWDTIRDLAPRRK